MTAIKNICGTTMFMQNGKLVASGNTESIIKQYLNYEASSNNKITFDTPATAPGNDQIKIKRIEAIAKTKKPSESVTIKTPIDIEVEFWNYVTDREINLSFHLNTMNYECVFNVGTTAQFLEAGHHKAICHIPGDFLNDGFYSVRMMFVAERSVILFDMADAINIEVHEEREESNWHGKWPGFVRPQLVFEICKNEYFIKD